MMNNKLLSLVSKILAVIPLCLTFAKAKKIRMEGNEIVPFFIFYDN